MDSITLQHRRLPRRFLHIFSIFIILALAFPSTGAATPNHPTADPHIVAALVGDWFEALEFASEAPVHIQIFDAPGGTLLWEGERLTDTSGNVHIGGWEHPVDLVPGVEIEIEDGTSAKELELEGVTLDVFDPVNDVLSGTAPPPFGRLVWVGTDSCSADLTSDPVTGAWVVDFSPCDVTEDTWAAARVFDVDGDVTEANPIPNPSFVIFPEWDQFDGNGWSSGLTVDISVAGKPECTTSGESFRYFFNGSFPESCDIVFGDVVTFSNGVTVRTHVVQNLDVTDLDLLNDTVSGTADPGAEVHVWPHATGQELVLTAGLDGSWLADFSGLFDIVFDEFGRSAIYDAQANATAVDWGIPNPHIVASLTWDWFEAQNFTPQTTIHGQIFDSPGGTLLWEADLLTDTNGYVHFGTWEHPVDLVPGVHIVLDDGTYLKELTLEDITLDVFDPVTDFLAGTAPAPYGRRVSVSTDSCSADITSDPATGAWEVDFSPCDVTEDTWGAAQVFDADGDVSEANRIPSPSFVIFPEWNAFDGNGWPTGATVNISVAGKPACTTAGESYRYFFNGEFPEGCDVVIGDTVTFTDGVTVRTHLVRNLAVTDLDLLADTVAGVADPGAEVFVWPHATGEALVLTADPDGSWLADFSGLFDIVAGEFGRSIIYDAQGNATAVDWGVPSPYFAVDPTTEWLDGLDWPDGALVEISVAGKPICALVKDSWDHFFNGNFPEGCDLVVGDVVTFTDGVTVRTHTVRQLAYGIVDIATDIAQGTAEEDATVYVWAWDVGGEVAVVATGGQWQVDFGTLGTDLLPGMTIRAEIRDEQRNATMVDYWIPNPRFTVFPEWEWFDGLDWPDGADVVISVAGKPLCTTSSESEDYFFNGGFPAGCNIVVGDVVTFSDGETIRTHTVQALAVSRVDKPGDSVAGTATAGAEVHVWPHDGPEVLVTADAGGDWLADFGGLFDIEPGQAGRAEIRDAQGNSTAVDWLAMYDLCLPVIFNP